MQEFYEYTKDICVEPYLIYPNDFFFFFKVYLNFKQIINEKIS